MSQDPLLFINENIPMGQRQNPQDVRARHKDWINLYVFVPFAHYVLPSVRVLKTERIRHPQQRESIKGFIASSSQGSRHIQHSGREQEPRAQIYSSIYKFRTKTGSWQGLIGCRGFLVFTDWPVIIPLIGQLSSLWLARVIIPRKPQKHDSGIIFGLVHLSEPVMALVRL